jgi:hypothetical protein
LASSLQIISTSHNARAKPKINGSNLKRHVNKIFGLFFERRSTGAKSVLGKFMPFFFHARLKIEKFG